MRTGVRLTMVWVGLVVLAGLFLLYSWVNAAISLDYARQQQKLDQQRIELLLEMLRHTSTSLTREGLERLIAEHYSSGHVIKRDGDRVQIDDLIFRFSGESVTQVSLLGEDAHGN